MVRTLASTYISFVLLLISATTNAFTIPKTFEFGVRVTDGLIKSPVQNYVSPVAKTLVPLKMSTEDETEEKESTWDRLTGPKLFKVIIFINVFHSCIKCVQSHRRCSLIRLLIFRP